MHNYSAEAATADVRLLTDAEIHAVSGGVSSSGLDILFIGLTVTLIGGLLSSAWDFIFG